MFIYIFLLLCITVTLWLVWQQKANQWKVLPFGLAMAPRVFTSLTKPILFFCHHKGLYTFIYVDDILVLTHYKLAREPKPCCPLNWFVLELHINFSKFELHLTQQPFILDLCWDALHMFVSLPSDKLTEIQQLAQASLIRQTYSLSGYVLFGAQTSFVPVVMCSFTGCAILFRVTC